MKFAFFYDYPESGTERVVKAFHKALESMGQTVDSRPLAPLGMPNDLPADFDMSLSSYDAAHFWNLRPYEHFEDTIKIPYGVSVHHIYPGSEKTVIEKLAKMSPYWVHTTDNFTEQNLGRYGVISFVTPQCIETDASPLPEAEFPNLACIGGNSDGFKRVEVIREAAKLLDIPSFIHDSSAEWISKEKVTQFFRDSYIYVNACFGCGGPVPPQEALLYGRPVVTTRISTMLETVREGINGEFFDGSAKGCAWAARRIMDNYPWYAQNAADTILNNPLKSAYIFLANIEEKLEEVA